MGRLPLGEHARVARIAGPHPRARDLDGGQTFGDRHDHGDALSASPAAITACSYRCATLEELTSTWRSVAMGVSEYPGASGHGDVLAPRAPMARGLHVTLVGGMLE